ncbi:hypothetical protein JNUCC42_04380 [Brevibacterium sp. JNUCC-42]|nr:hypothetical protein JNUCC42_04380 [Brevibacterium sp. JNUCC-42]
MTLQEFIDLKQRELVNTELYREVEFKSAIDVGLSKNSTAEEFISTKSDLYKEVIEVLSLSALPETRVNIMAQKLVLMF